MTTQSASELFMSYSYPTKLIQKNRKSTKLRSFTLLFVAQFLVDFVKVLYRVNILSAVKRVSSTTPAHS